MTSLTVGLLLARVILGAYVGVHGLQNLTPWFGGGGLAATARGFAAGGLRGGRPAAALAALMQVGSGLLLILGLVTPLAAMAAVGVMAVATKVHLAKGFWAQADGCEYALFLALAALRPLWAGPGAWSLDRVLGIAGPLAWAWALAATMLAGVLSAVTAAGLSTSASSR